MKRLLIAAGTGTLILVSSAAAFADGARSDAMPRVVDRVAEATKAPVDAAAPVKLENGAPVVATAPVRLENGASVPAAASYSSRIQANTTPAFSRESCKGLGIYGAVYSGGEVSAERIQTECEDKKYPMVTAALIAVGIAGTAVALNDSSESD